MENKTNETQHATPLRQANFEFLRILSMAMVVMMHFLGHGELLEKSQFGTVSYSVYWWLRAVAYPGVNCFVMLTGYFMVTSKAKPSKFFSFAFQVLCYSLVCFAVYMLLGGDMSFAVLRNSVFPLISKTYWFATVYALLYVAIPLLNRLIAGMNQKQHLIWLGLLLVVYCVVPTIFYWSRDYLSGGNNLPWFIILYMTAAYIRLYGLPLKKGVCLLGYLASVCLLLVSNLAVAWVTQRLLGQPKVADILYRNNSPLVYAAAICLFGFFKELKLSSGPAAKWITAAAPLSFGVYLLHENPLLREYIWNAVRPYRFMDGTGTVVSVAFMCGTVAVFLVIGCGVDWLYKRFYRLVKPAERKIDMLCAGAAETIGKRFFSEE